MELLKDPMGRLPTKPGTLFRKVPVARAGAALATNGHACAPDRPPPPALWAPKEPASLLNVSDPWGIPSLQNALWRYYSQVLHAQATSVFTCTRYPVRSWRSAGAWSSLKTSGRLWPAEVQEYSSQRGWSWGAWTRPSQHPQPGQVPV